MAAARQKSEAMSKVDAAWLHMDSPTNMMMITGVDDVRPANRLPTLQDT